MQFSRGVSLKIPVVDNSTVEEQIKDSKKNDAENEK